MVWYYTDSEAGRLKGPHDISQAILLPTDQINRTKYPQPHKEAKTMHTRHGIYWTEPDAAHRNRQYFDRRKTRFLAFVHSFLAKKEVASESIEARNNDGFLSCTKHSGVITSYRAMIFTAQIFDFNIYWATLSWVRFHLLDTCCKNIVNCREPRLKIVIAALWIVSNMNLVIHHYY